MQLAREYVSTTYCSFVSAFFQRILIAIVVNHFVDWSAILNVDAAYSSELNIVFGILAFFFCLNIVASIFTTMLTANQKPALASLIQTLGQVFGFICIYILTKTVPGNLDVLAFAFSGVPCFLLIISLLVCSWVVDTDIFTVIPFRTFFFDQKDSRIGRTVFYYYDFHVFLYSSSLILLFHE